MANIPPEKRFYLDETGNYLNLSPLYGRSKCGQAVYDVKPTNSSKTINAVAILTEDGIKATYIYTTTLTASVFIRYLDIHAIPILTNEQTLIMDNHPVHHAKAINTIYLPTYSPEA